MFLIFLPTIRFCYGGRKPADFFDFTVKDILRVAFFPDSFLEVNGVAMTSNRLVNFARKRGFPMLCVHAGEKTEVTQDGSITFVKLRRSPAAVNMDEGLRYDPLFQRHAKFVKKALDDFQPDVFHITGLNDVSILGAYLAWKTHTAMVASWHTNLHEYAARRLRKPLKFLPENSKINLTNLIERKILDGAKLYYKMPQIILAPNMELVEMLEKGTGRKTRLMIRGVDTEMYSPEFRTISDGVTRFGFVGRLRAEKNVRMLVEIEKSLLAAGKSNFKFLVVGEGSEREWLEQNLVNADFTGFLEGAKLAEAYANMDVFIFPSETDTFGNVIQEANASAVPCIVSNLGGPKFIVEPGKTGFVAENVDEFAAFAVELIEKPEKLEEMKKLSREFAVSRSWETVFEKVYEVYSEAKNILDKAELEKINGIKY